MCSSCFESPPCKKDCDEFFTQNIKCTHCFRYFKDENCYLNHQIKKPENTYSVCDRFSICQYCFKFIDQIKLDKYKVQNHSRDHIECLKCNKIVKNNHGCTIQPYKRAMCKKFVIYFYDIETVQKKEQLDEKKKFNFYMKQ